MANPVYSVADLIDKTITAASTVPVYLHVDDNAAPDYTVGVNQPIGTLYSWISPGSLSSNLWFQYLDSNQNPFYTKWAPGYYNFDILEAQGLTSVQQQAAAAANANLPWYQQLINQYGPWIIGTIVAVAVVKGFFSRPRKSAS